MLRLPRCCQHLPDDKRLLLIPSKTRTFSRHFWIRKVLSKVIHKCSKILPNPLFLRLIHWNKSPPPLFFWHAPSYFRQPQSYFWQAQSNIFTGFWTLPKRPVCGNRIIELPCKCPIWPSAKEVIHLFGTWWLLTPSLTTWIWPLGLWRVSVGKVADAKVFRADYPV